MTYPHPGGDATAVITIHGLTKDFGETRALRDIDLRVERGELLGLLGPNGAGKTTLISVLSTILRPTSGRVTVCGYDVERDQDQVRHSIGIVFQDPSLDEDLTGEENLDFHGRLYGMRKSIRLRRIDEVLALVDLQGRRGDLVKTYSGGMRRRLEIARGLMHRPEVLFLDEPTLGLDPQTRRRIWDYILDLRQASGMTIILTTHYMDEADRLCSRIAIMDRGEIVAMDTPLGLKGLLGGDLIELEMLEPVPLFLERIRDFPSVRDISVQDGAILITAVRGESLIPQVVNLAGDCDARIDSVSLRRPNLEDVFIRLTGRDIREEGPAGARDRIRIYMKQRRR